MSTSITHSVLAETRFAETRTVRILAKSTYRELKSSGLSRSDMVGFASELLGLVTADMQSADSDPASTATLRSVI